MRDERQTCAGEARMRGDSDMHNIRRSTDGYGWVRRDASEKPAGRPRYFPVFLAPAPDLQAHASVPIRTHPYYTTLSPVCPAFAVCAHARTIKAPEKVWIPLRQGYGGTSRRDKEEERGVPPSLKLRRTRQRGKGKTFPKKGFPFPLCESSLSREMDYSSISLRAALRLRRILPELSISITLTVTKSPSLQISVTLLTR